MRISAKGEYAIKAILDLTLNGTGGLVPVQAVAARQAIPHRYLEQVLLALKRAGLLAARRGSAGGYQLTRPPEAVTVGEVLRAVEGHRPPLEALGGRPGGDLAGLWEEIAGAVSKVVDGLTFGELAARVRERREAGRPMYHI